MSLNRFLLLPLAATALMATTGAAQAALTSYTASSSFQAALISSGTDTYTGFNITATTSSPITRSAGSFGYTATAANGFFGAGSPADPFLSTNDAGTTISFQSFTGGSVSGIGGNFFGTNLSGLYAAGGVTIFVADSLGATLSTAISPTSTTAGSFLAFTTDGVITSLTVTAISGLDPLWSTVDNLTLGTVVPEPETYALFAAGLAMLGFLRRRRRV